VGAIQQAEPAKREPQAAAADQKPAKEKKRKHATVDAEQGEDTSKGEHRDASEPSTTPAKSKKPKKAPSEQAESKPSKKASKEAQEAGASDDGDHDGAAEDASKEKKPRHIVFVGEPLLRDHARQHGQKNKNRH
jgi:hypothetical protein